MRMRLLLFASAVFLSLISSSCASESERELARLRDRVRKLEETVAKLEAGLAECDANVAFLKHKYASDDAEPVKIDVLSPD